MTGQFFFPSAASPSSLPTLHPREMVVLFLRDRLSSFSTCRTSIERAEKMCEIFLFLLDHMDVLEAHFMGNRLIPTIYKKCLENLRQPNIMEHHPLLFHLSLQLRDQTRRLLPDQEDHPDEGNEENEENEDDEGNEGNEDDQEDQEGDRNQN